MKAEEGVKELSVEAEPTEKAPLISKSETDSIDTTTPDSQQTVESPEEIEPESAPVVESKYH